MSILTKIFVVLATVLSLLLVALLVPFVQQSEELKVQKGDLEQQVSVLKQSAESASQREQAARAEATETKVAAEAQRAELLDANSKLLSKLDTVEGNLTTRTAELREARSRNGELAGAQQLNAQIIETLSKEVNDRRAETLDLRTKNIALSNRVNELTTQSETLVQNVRLLKEQMAVLEETSVQPATQQTAGTVETAPVSVPVASGVPVRGQITDVRQVGEVTFVALNVGANDQVREGMEFMIHKGNTFLGNVIITKVDLNSAAGRVTLAKGEIMPQQQVLTGGF